MKWIKIIDKSKTLPCEPYAYTDGEGIVFKHCERFRPCAATSIIGPDKATHYILLKDIPLPKGLNNDL